MLALIVICSTVALVSLGRGYFRMRCAIAGVHMPTARERREARHSARVARAVPVPETFTRPARQKGSVKRPEPVRLQFVNAETGELID